MNEIQLRLIDCLSDFLKQHGITIVFVDADSRVLIDE
jgi:ABC-type dipeptide/oligopeptide/nickel transport system ATPase subunit